MSTPLKKSVPISKSLLTPCRRVGLSRIRKTPDSITQLIKHTPTDSSSTGRDPPKTLMPVRLKEASNPILDSPLAEVPMTNPLELKIDPSLKSRETLLGKSSIGKATKKSLEQKFVKGCYDNNENVDVKKRMKDKSIKLEDSTVTKLPKLPAGAKAKISKNGPQAVPELSVVEEGNEDFVKIRKKKTRELSDDSLSNSEEVCETVTDIPTFEDIKKGRATRVLPEDEFSEICSIDTNIYNKIVIHHSTANTGENLIKDKKDRKMLSQDVSSNFPNEGTDSCVEITNSPTVTGDQTRKTQLSSEVNLPVNSNTCKKTARTPKKRPLVDEHESFIAVKEKKKRLLSDSDLLGVSNSQKSTDSDDGRLKKSESKTEKLLKKKISIRQSLGEDSDDDFLTIKRKKVNEGSGDYISSSQGLEQEMSHISSQNFCVKLKKLSVKDLATHQTPKGNIPVILDDDDEAAFTSTPKEQQSERADFLSNIGALELRIKEKGKMLDDLKRAATYKNKHDIDKLQLLIEVWRKGCVAGLMALQEKLQAHSPISMETLLFNLHIPSEIAKNKLKIQ